MKQRGGGGDFKSPGSAGTPDSPGNAKKKRRASTAGSGSTGSSPAVSSSQMPELAPPPMSAYGESLVASNPFDDTPPPRAQMGGPGLPRMCSPPMSPFPRQMGPGGPPHMSMGPGSGPMSGMQMGPDGPVPQMGGMPMGGGPGMDGMPMNHGQGPGGPMGQMQMNPNMGPGGPMGPGHPRGPPPHRMMEPMGHGGHHHGPPMGGMCGPNMSPMGPNGPMNQMSMGHGGGGPMGHGGPRPPHGMDSHGGPRPPHPMDGHGGPMGPCGPGSNGPPMNGMPPGMGMGQPWQGPPKPLPVQSGKLYPHDQPMVFNPQNPNAPPIYPCGVCHKEVHDNDQAIPCESGCNFWFHRVCTGLTEGAFHFLTQEIYAEWVCDKCLSNKAIPLVKFKP